VRDLLIVQYSVIMYALDWKQSDRERRGLLVTEAPCARHRLKPVRTQISRSSNRRSRVSVWHDARPAGAELTSLRARSCERIPSSLPGPSRGSHARG
jgi:hypothetical protein